MTQSQLEYFLVVAREMSISRASEILFVSQPAVSRQLSQLEEELDVKLFKRGNRQLEITEAGKAYQELFSQFNYKLSELKRRFSKKDLVAKHNLGCLEGWNIAFFYKELQKYLATEYANMQVHISGFNMDRILFALRNGKIDTAIVFESLFDDYQEIVTHKIGYTESILLYSRNHPLVGSNNLMLIDFRNDEFCVTAPVGFRNAFTNQTMLCQQAGFSPKYRHVQTLSEALMLVQTGECVMIADKLLMAKDNPLYCVLPLKGSRRNICLAYLKECDSAATEKVHSDILKFFGNKGQDIWAHEM